MPRKTRDMIRHESGVPRFNEAAARCRGKHRLSDLTLRRPRASMRPRPDAAENGEGGGIEMSTPGFNEAAARCRGKLRLARRCESHSRSFNEAAARCRGKPAGRGCQRSRRAPASMRPRPDAAENGCCRGPARQPAPSFNEAAARCRGKRRVWTGCSVSRQCFNEAAARCRGKPGAPGLRGTPEADASMRPRPDAAENREQPPALRMAPLTLQ